MELLQLNYGTMQSTDGRIWARFYALLTGMWLTPDPAGQFSNPFGFGGDPVNYTDSDGKFIFTAFLIGAAIGAYMGAATVNKSANFLDWDYSDMSTYGGMIAGAAIGGSTGVIGAAIGGGSFVGSATASLAFSSTFSSSGFSSLGGGDGTPTTNLGAFSIDWKDYLKGDFSKGTEWHDPFDDDPWYVNLLDAGGWASNAGDLAGAIQTNDITESPEQIEINNQRNGKKAWHGKKLGPINLPGDPEDEIDGYAFGHDLDYDARGAFGIKGALSNRSVAGADLKLAYGATKVMTKSLYGGIDNVTKLPIEFFSMQNAWAAGVATVFTPLAYAKFLQQSGIQQNTLQY